MGKRWIRYIRNFFGFTQTEARGFSAMAVLLVLLYAAVLIYQAIPAETYTPAADKRLLDSLISQLEAADTVRPQFAAPSRSVKTPAARAYFEFNPNSVSYDSLLQLGFPVYLAKRLVKYRDKGGKFRKKEDMLKLYGLPKTLYKEVEPWIRLPAPAEQFSQKWEEHAPAEPYKATPKHTPAEKFDLNLADSLQLLSVRGIGPVLSGRILKFREALGGFASAEQVKEVWGLPPEAASALLERASLEAPTLRLLPINTADVSLLDHHPYISHQQAARIVAYRAQHGNFQQADELLKIHGLDEAFVQKIRPYLQF